MWLGLLFFEIMSIGRLYFKPILKEAREYNAILGRSLYSSIVEKARCTKHTKTDIDRTAFLSFVTFER
jgi:hypothetical protein